MFFFFLLLFCRYLISQGANVGGVNSEGETPLDIAEEEAMEELLQNEINRQGAFIHLLFFFIFTSFLTLLPPSGHILLPRCYPNTPKPQMIAWCVCYCIYKGVAC